MAAFNLTAQLQLQAPTNTSQVVGNIKKQLSGITANVQVKGNAGALAKINKQLQGVNKSADSSAKSVGNLNRNLSEAARRFSVITVATGTMLALARAIKNSVGEAIAFERELVKISQVTGKTVSQLGGLTDEVTRLSKSLGASSADLLNVSRVLAQAGFTAQKTKQALDILAKTSLGATFDSIQDTTEGAIAVLRQFGDEAKRVGGDIKFLEQTMDAINSVSKKFAVESGDLITVIRRVGGVFASAGGEVNELISLFTSVRATTRESAETIATGLRTIFTRIQRTDTVDQLAELGIQLRDSQGQFVGAFEAVNRLAQGLSSLDPRDFRFSEIVESLGGFRQVGKVIPLIRQFTTAQDALNVAQAASGSVARDAATAQQSLQVQAQKVTQDFQALIRTLVDSSTFRSVAKGALEMASAFIKIVEAIEPLLPLITSLIALKIGSALAPGLGALTGMKPRGKAGGGRIHAFAKGGFVPGTGNRDTVPAMLSPGEFVIRKSSVKKMGAGALEAMNNNRFGTGGKMSVGDARSILKLKKDSPDWKALSGASGNDPKTVARRAALFKKAKLKQGQTFAAGYPGGAYETIPGAIGAFVLQPEKGSDGGFNLSGAPIEFEMPGPPRIDPETGKKSKKNAALRGGSSFKTYFPDRADLKENAKIATLVREGAQNALKEGVKSIGIQAASFLNVPGELDTAIDGISKGADAIAADMKGAVRTVEGFVFEGLIQGVTGAELAGEGAAFDFPDVQGGVADKLEAMFGSGTEALIKADAKRGLDAAKGRTEGSLAQKTIQDIKAGKTKPKHGIQQLAAGGKIDSVPALLTPGEYVVNKSAAQSIGYSNLNKMNQTGVQKFAAGGAVNTRRHAYGSGSTNINTIDPLSQDLQSAVGALDPKNAALLNRAMQDNAGQFNALATELKGVEPDIAEAALKAFARGAMKGEKDLVTLGTEAADTATTVARLKSTTNKTASQIASDAQKLKDLQSGGTAPLSSQLPPSPQQRIAGGALQQSQDAASAAAVIGIGVSGSGDAAGDLDKNMAHYTNLIKSGVDHQKALNDVMGNLEKTDTKSEALKKKLNAAIEKRIASVKTAIASAKSAPGRAAKGVKNAILSPIQTAKGIGTGIARGGARLGAAAKQGQGLAQSAQQAVFFGSAIAATTIQMSSLSETTKQAATETVAFAATLVAGASTAVDMLANLASVGKVAAAAEATETGSSLTSAGADTTEAVASTAVSIPLLLVAAAVLGLILVLKYFSAQAKAEADALAKGRKESLERLGAGEGAGGDAASAKASIGEEFDLRQESEVFNSAAIGAGAMAASFAIAGATIGSGIPVLGTAIGALIGAAAGYTYAVLSQDAAAVAEAEARREQIASIYGSIDAIEQFGKAGKKFDDAMADLDKLPAPTTDAGKQQRIEQELDLGNELASGVPVAKVGAEFGKLAELAAAAGKTVAQLSEADFDEDDADGARDLAAFQTASQGATMGLEQLAKKTSAARQTLQKAADLEITGEFSFDELVAQGGLFAQALKASQDAIRAETQARVQKAQADVKAANITIEAANKAAQTGEISSDEALGKIKKAEEEKAAAMAEGNAAIDRGNKQLKSQDDAYRMSTEAAKKRRDADIQAAKAAEVLRKQLLQTTNFMMALNEIEFNQQETEKALGNQAALQSGGDLDFSRTAPAGLSGDLTLIKDLNQFNQEMLSAINDYPPGLRKEAKRQLAIVTQASKIFSTGRDNVLKNFGAPVKGKFGPEQQKDIIRAAGLDPDKLDKDVLKQIMAQIVATAQDGISAEDFDQIFGPLQEQGTAAQANLQQMQELRNNELKNYSTYLDILQSKRDKQIKAVQNFLSVQEKSAELLATARGGKVSIGAKQRGRTRSAQVALSGTGVRAGDAAGASQALREAKKRRAIIAEEIKNRRASGQSIKAHMELDKKLQDVIKKTTAELERLADQSDRASDIMAEIDKEKEKREVITSLITDFVVGGEDDRKAILNATAGVQMAVQTGTLQNQSPEQRAATVGLLDKLENIAIPGAGGLTGREVKQELVFRDAIRMGLDPEVARQLATATTKEEQLIKALEKLTETMLAAAAGLVPPPPAAVPPGMAGPWTGGYITSSGGVAYRAGGGSIFQPKGTDTVPAMLTPGEYVIKKSAVDKIGKGNLAALNNGYANGGLVQYRAGGGGIGAGGTIESKGMMSYDQVRASFADAATKLGLGRTLEILKQDGGLSPEQRKAMFNLISRGKLDIRQLTTPNSWARSIGEFANYAETEDFIKGAANGRLLVRGPKFGWMPPLGSKASSPAFQNWSNSIGQYNNSVIGIRNKLIDIFGNQGTITDNYGIGRRRAAGRIFEEGLGWDMSRYGNLPFGLNEIVRGKEELQRWTNTNMRGGVTFTETKRNQLIAYLNEKGVNLSGSQIIGGGQVTQSRNPRTGELLAGGGDFEKERNPQQRVGGNRGFQNMLNLLQQQGLIMGFAQGGNVPGTDTVPAMLTPGEFVMSKAAVAQHGVGYMKSLNRGRIPGFNRGGVVGHGGVQYKKDGGAIGRNAGVLSIDPKALQNVLTTFRTDFSLTLDRIVRPLDNMSRSLLEVAKSFERLEMFHTFKGELGLSVNIGNKDAIIAAVSEGIAPSIEQLITDTVNAQLTNVFGKP